MSRSASGKRGQPYRPRVKERPMAAARDPWQVGAFWPLPRGGHCRERAEPPPCPNSQPPEEFPNPQLDGLPSGCPQSGHLQYKSTPTLAKVGISQGWGGGSQTKKPYLYKRVHLFHERSSEEVPDRVRKHLPAKLRGQPDSATHPELTETPSGRMGLTRRFWETHLGDRRPQCCPRGDSLGLLLVSESMERDPL